MALLARIRARGAQALTLFVAGVTALSAVHAQNVPELHERQIKAAYIYKLSGYVTWPETAFAGPDSPVVIGIAGADAVADELARLVSNRTIDKHPVTVKRIRRGDPLTGLHVLFIGGSDSSPVSEWLPQVRGQPLLTITENDSGLAGGSVVNLVVEANRVRFDVALDAAERNRIKLSASLLSVARQIRGKPS